jgi:pyruvate formate lyase activating enzyme
MRIRIPIVPGVNDSEENVEATARFVAAELNRSTPVHLIPYHKMGLSKNNLMEVTSEREFVLPEAARMEELRALIASFGLEAIIGG